MGPGVPFLRRELRDESLAADGFVCKINGVVNILKPWEQQNKWVSINGGSPK